MSLDRRAFLAASASVVASAALSSRLRAETQLFSADAVRGDLDAVWTALLEVGAEPFRTSDRQHVEALYRKTRAGITAAMTLGQAYIAIATVLGALNDGHVGLGFPGSLSNAPRRFPFRFALSDGDDLVVISDHTNTVPINSTVVGVEGIAPAVIRDTILTCDGAQTRALHRSRLSTGGAWPSVALFGIRDTYHIEWIAPDGTRGTADVPAAMAAKGAPIAPYTYSTLRDGTVGYIDYRSCEDLDAFKIFLNQTFTRIGHESIKALVIDIRRNGGGESELNDALWTYVSTKPFKQFGGMIVRASARLKREYGHDKYVDYYGKQAWDAPDGTLITTGADPNVDLIVPPPLENRYTGPVYLLISTSTFSSAMSCALAAKDYGLATIVGEETGEPVNSTGEVYTETTPAIGFQAGLTTKVFLAPKPHPNDEGVVPDIPVVTTPADQAAGRDPVMERVFSLISA